MFRRLPDIDTARVRITIDGVMHDVRVGDSVAAALLAGTAVTTDFVELPSQLFEHWLEQPEVLRKFAVDGEGRPMPDALLDKVLRARTFNQGFATVEYTSSALVDLDLHRALDGRGHP